MARHFKALLSTEPTDSDDILAGDYVAGDTLNGLGGNDRLIGWGGADTLTGGSGADTFAIAPASLMSNDGWNFSPDRDGERDHIADFNSAEGDKIELSGLFRCVDTDGDFRSELYFVTWADVEIESLGGNDYRVHVHQVTGDPTFDLGIDVVGTAPTEGDFIFH